MSKAAGWLASWVGLLLMVAVAAATDDPAVEQAANDFRRRDADQDQQRGTRDEG
ncbi:MAG TPA: hypothetical protein PK867_24580 [Pirellulales bacterium]|nr:hypothetical protein [Pirellulales bacterium]